MRHVTVPTGRAFLPGKTLNDRTETEHVSFGDLLREHRLAANLSQEALAERSGLSVRGISDLERGARTHPYPETIKMLANALHLGEDELNTLREAARRRSRAALPRSAQGLTAALPAPLTRLIDRETEVARVSDLLHDESVRLVTLTGPGGVGKTRLALAVADELNGTFSGGKIFVDLATLERSASVPTAIASALGVSERGAMPLAESLPRAIGDHRLLVVLDNYEHLLEAAPVVADMLRATANVKALVTSREALHVRGEREFVVSPLSLVRRGEGPGSDALVASGAMQLFVERAVEADARFRLTKENAAAVAGICQRLDGLPLAIELAAAWTKLLPPETLLARLEQRLPLLTGGPRDAPTRQRTLRNAIAWSFDLLLPEEQEFFSRLSVFNGGWDLDAVERVANREKPDTTLMLLGSMVDKSLIWRADTRLGPRFTMLETIREFATERLEQNSAEDFATRLVHAEYFLALAEKAQSGLVGTEQERWLSSLDAEDGNLRAALNWTLQNAAPAAGLRFSRALWRYWSPRGRLSDGRYWLEQALARAGEDGSPADVRADAHNALGNILGDLSEFAEARRHYEAALDLRREIADAAGIAGALNNLGVIAYWFADYEDAARLHRESLALWQSIDDRFGEALSHGNLGDVYMVQGDFGRAREHHMTSLRLRESIHDATRLAYAWYNLGELARLEGNLPEAKRQLAESVSRFESLGDLMGLAYAEMSLADVASAEGQVAQAAELLDRALETRTDMGDRRGVIECLETLAVMAMRAGHDDDGLRLFGAARGQRAVLRCPTPPSLLVEYERAIASARKRLGAFNAEKLLDEGAVGLEPVHLVARRALDGIRATAVDRSSSS